MSKDSILIQDLWRHNPSIHKNSAKTFNCESCDKTFSEKSNLKRHEKTVHEIEKC